VNGDIDRRLPGRTAGVQQDAMMRPKRQAPQIDPAPRRELGLHVEPPPWQLSIIAVAAWACSLFCSPCAGILHFSEIFAGQGRGIG
jgi:hypothetical protein